MWFSFDHKLPVWMAHFLLSIGLLSSSIQISYAIDSTSIASAKFNGVRHVNNSMKQCCKSVIDREHAYKIDCYSGNKWECPVSGYGDAGDYSGQFTCAKGYVFMAVSTYAKYNWTHAGWQQMIRAGWCAPMKTECSWIPSDSDCNSSTPSAPAGTDSFNLNNLG